mgnify:CR=1 FL=1
MCSFLAFGQKGKDGDVVVSNNQVVNAYTPVISPISSGDLSILVQSNQLIGGVFNTPLEGGDLVYIYQAQGADISELNNNTYGEITDYNGSGFFDLVQVADVIGNQEIILDCPVNHDYDLSGNVQIVRVPRFNSLNITEFASITSSPWNGFTGGLLVIEVKEELIVDGLISATAHGFRGGEKENNFSNSIIIVF